MAINQKFKRGLKVTCAKLIPNSLQLQYLANVPKLETWRKKYKNTFPIFPERYKMYDYINQEILNNDAINYLEFGVYQGDSFKHWVKANTNDSSKFYGFDTFTGLPEDWTNFTQTLSKNTFDVQGKFPDIEDDRVSFIKGVFQDTLDPFLEKFKSDKRLVIHNDSDMYSSTLYTLAQLNKIAVKGTIIIFDEFSSALHEFRALEDYCSAYGREYKVLAGTKKYFTQVAIQLNN